MLCSEGNQEPKFLIWCTTNENRIIMHDLETKNNSGPFEGAQIIHRDSVWTLIKELGDTNMILSAGFPNNDKKAANFEVFDVSKGKLLPTFRFTQIDEVEGRGDVTYNKKRNFAALMPVQEKIAYHLFDCTKLDIICRSKWQKPHLGKIESLDIDPSGAFMVTIDKGGVCVISDINDNGKYIKHISLDQTQEIYSRTNRCRWNPLAESSQIYLTYDGNRLNILDVEKLQLILKEPQELDSGENCTRWIDCRYDGNLLASGGWDGITNVYDHRADSIIKKLKDDNYIYSVRWSTDGQYLATACANGRSNHTSFLTESVVSTSTFQKDTPCSVCYV